MCKYNCVNYEIYLKSVFGNPFMLETGHQDNSSTSFCPESNILKSTHLLV